MNNFGKVGVVTVTYNSAQVIHGFMASFLKQTYPDLVLYVVDSGSVDRTLELLAQYPQHYVNRIICGANIGVAAGNNRGISAALRAGCRAILLINNDTEFEADLVEKLADALQRYACDLVAPKMLYFDDPQRIWCAGGDFQPLKGYLGRHRGEGEQNLGQYDEPRRIEHAPTCCLLARKEVFERVGLMDERYFVYFDDGDFTFRAKKAGLSMWYVPQATLLHKVSSLTGGGQSDFSIRFNARNHVYFMLKHLSWKNLYYLPAYQLRLLMKLLFRRIDGRGFALRERAFFEGLRLWAGTGPLGSNSPVRDALGHFDS